MISIIEAITPRGNKKIQFSLSRKTNAQAKQVTKSNLPNAGDVKVKNTMRVYRSNVPKPNTKRKLWVGGFKGTRRK